MTANSSQFGSVIYTDGRLPHVSLNLGRSFFKNYNCLWDPTFQSGSNTLVDFFVDNLGVISPLGGFNLSAPIPVNYGSVLVVMNDAEQVLNAHGGFYDKKGKWVSSLASNAIYQGQPVLFNVPKNAFSVRINFSPSNKWYVGQRRTGLEQLLKPIYSVSFEGDSVTSGSGPFYTKNYPTLLGEKANCIVYNNAQGGRYVSGNNGMHATIKNTNHLSQYGVIMGGVNDYVNNIALGNVSSIDTNEFSGALNSIGKYLANGRTWQKWYFLSPLPQSLKNPNDIGIPLTYYCSRIQAMCSTYGITYIDSNSELGIDLRQPFMKHLFGSDEIHYNWIGIDMLSDYVLNVLLTR
jgi:hypothetical protein